MLFMIDLPSEQIKMSFITSMKYFFIYFTMIFLEKLFHYVKNLGRKSRKKLCSDILDFVFLDG